MKQIRFGSTSRQSGFTLIEALIALLVMSFGMLAIAGLQFTMSRNSDAAKQRSEAMRLAQQQIETLRSFSTVEPSAGFDYANDVVSGNATFSPSAGAYTTNTSYGVAWAVTQEDGVTDAVASDAQKWINVTVAWADRVGDNQSITLRSVIARNDPIDLGSVFPQTGRNRPRTPKNRNINIPYPAIQLDGGQSAFQPPGSADSFVFDDVSGDVLGYCTGALAEGASINLDSSAGAITTGCTVQKAYLLSGYLVFLNSVTTGGTERNRDNATSSSTDATRGLLSGTPASIAFVGTPPSVAPQCFAERQKVVRAGSISPQTIQNANRSGTLVTVDASNHGFLTGQVVSISVIPAPSAINGVFTITKVNNGTFTYNTVASGAVSATGGSATLVQELTIPELLPDGTVNPGPTGYTTVKARFVAYTCIVVPLDEDGVTTNRDTWSGQFYITTDGTWSLGTASGTYKVCRFTGDYKSDNVMSNSEHPRTYRRVSEALDNQNYLVLPNSESCPSDDETNPLADDYVNVNAVLHQSSTTGPTYGGLPSQGTQWGGASDGEQGSETVFPMF